jgi:hypothetical protein
MNILLKSLTIMLSLIAALPAMENENTNLGNCSPEVAYKFLTEVAKDNYVKHDFTQFIESVRNLKEVCSQWNLIIDEDFMHEAMVLGCKQICPEFLNGKLIYRPKLRSDEGMIELKISDLWNPLGGTFNLSQCGDTGNYLSISTGYRKVKKAENPNKLEIWFTPRFLVEKEIQGTAGYFKEVFPAKWQTTALVGIIWTWGGWECLSDSFDYLTTENTDNLSKIDLYENWKKAAWGRVARRDDGRWMVLAWHELSMITPSCFTFMN